MTLTALSQKLDIEQSALEGMLAYWVNKGHLKQDHQTSETSDQGHTTSCCETACSETANCVFLPKVPKVYTYAAKNDQTEHGKDHN